MPIESKAQQSFMFANQNAPGSLGKAAKDFIAAGPKGGSYSDLPEKVGKQGNAKAGAAVKQGFNSLIKKSRSLKHGI